MYFPGDVVRGGILSMGGCCPGGIAHGGIISGGDVGWGGGFTKCLLDGPKLTFRHQQWESQNVRLPVHQ